MASNIPLRPLTLRANHQLLCTFMNWKTRFALGALFLWAYSNSVWAMNNDGYTDLLWRNAVTRENRVWAMNAGANGATPLPLASAADADSPGQALALTLPSIQFGQA